jgi:hypothetical protein
MSWLSDLSGNSHDATVVGGVTEDTTDYKFTPSSAEFDGSTGYLTIPDSADWEFGDGDFTIDLWVRFHAIGLGNTYLVMQSEASNNRWFFGLQRTTTIYRIFLYSCTPGPVPLSALWTISALTLDTWYHLEVGVVSASNLAYAFVTGASQGTKSWTVTMPSAAAPLLIGASPTDGKYTDGEIDELRISKGIARHTATFTPETSEYDPDAYTKLLMHFGGVGNLVSVQAFKEFEWRDHTLNPTHVYVVANRVDKADGTWDADELVVGEYIAP